MTRCSTQTESRLLWSFFGARLSLEELTNIWNFGEGENSYVQDNVCGIIAAASSKFSLAQFELLNKLDCVADIKQTTHCVLPAVEQLYAICKSYSGKGISMYNKAILSLRSSKIFVHCRCL